MELLSHRPVGLQPLLTLRPRNGVMVKIHRVDGSPQLPV
jgi:hypothetical protein